ncbi:recombinase RecT [Fusobacterium sp.]|uniref:recombinase RecT n=1 Tax=Fusobacterium sp. TaxID=68766 RepID=UPI000E96D0E2|nr:recombinase RecT [Fusobacterium sp.]HBJ80146.1 recombinase [Fusobacterium sp.]
MATAKNKLATLDNTSNTGVPALKSMLATQAIKKQIKSLLGERAGHFMMAIVQVVEGTPQLQEADPQSIINAAIASAVLNLPIEKNLGFAYIVPYNDRERGMIAQFQMGYKGYIQLALRSGEYKFINAIEVKEGELKGYNILTGELELEFIEDLDERMITKTIGYASYIEFNNGFRNTLFMTEAQVKNHAKKYSQAYQYDLSKGYKYSNWSKNFEAMALKTVLKLNLSKYGALSVEVQKALQTDGLVIEDIDEDGTIIGEFTDNTGDTVEIISDIPANDEDRTALLKQATPLNINLVEVVKKELKIDFDKMSKTQAKEIEEYIDTKLEEKM